MQIQNFSLAIDNDEVVSVLVQSPLSDDTLDGSSVEWCAYAQASGIPSGEAVIVKTTGSPSGVAILTSPPMTFTIGFEAADTASLDPGNYYHEATVTDVSGNRTTVLSGILTLTETLNP